MDNNVNPVVEPTVTPVASKKEPNSKKNIFIVCGVVLVLVLIAAISCPFIMKALEKKAKEEREKEFTEKATEYYEQYMSSVIGIDEAEVTLEAITKSKIELNKTAKCDASSKVTFSIDANGKIKDKKIELKCN